MWCSDSSDCQLIARYAARTRTRLLLKPGKFTKQFTLADYADFQSLSVTASSTELSRKGVAPWIPIYK